MGNPNIPARGGSARSTAGDHPLCRPCAQLRVIPFDYGGSHLLETSCNAAPMLAPPLLLAAAMDWAVEAPSLRAARRLRRSGGRAGNVG